MTDKATRREKVAAFKRTGTPAGVYAIRNTKNGRVFVGSALNLTSVRSKLDFARATQSAGSGSVLDHRLVADAKTFGLDAFEFEILEQLDVRPEMTPQQVRQDLTALEELWHEKFAPEDLY